MNQFAPRQEPMYFKNLTVQELINWRHLAKAYIQAADNGWVLKSYGALLNFCSLAQYCVRKGKNPGALFVHLVTKKEYQAITDKDEQKGRIITTNILENDPTIFQYI